MQTTRTGWLPNRVRFTRRGWKRTIYITGTFLIAFSLFIAVWVTLTHQAAIPAKPVQIISQAALEETYGLRVNLVALTAAGGMVDVRLKMVNGQKSSLLLKDKEHFPVLVVDGSSVRIQAPEETRSQQIQFVDNGGLYIIYPNSSNAVKSGSKLSIQFGDIRLEPIEVR